jgi:hypothetical protein
MQAVVSLAPRLLRAAWLAVLIGLAIQGLTVAVGALVGVSSSALSALLGAVGKVSWSTLVCLGVLIGLSLPRATLRSAAGWGFLSAPIAFHGARAMQHGLAFALELPIGSQGSALLIAGSLIKATQYAALAGTLAWLKQRPDAGPGSFFGVGLAHGFTFGVLFVAVTAWLSQQTGIVQLAPTIVNEVLFPACCALVIYVTTRAQRLIASPGTRGARQLLGADEEG